jgi:hypothetical protein
MSSLPNGTKLLGSLGYSGSYGNPVFFRYTISVTFPEGVKLTDFVDVEYNRDLDVMLWIPRHDERDASFLGEVVRECFTKTPWHDRPRVCFGHCVINVYDTNTKLFIYAGVYDGEQVVAPQLSFV